MAKKTATTFGSGFASGTALDAESTTIADHLNNKVLYRNNPVGEPNTMENELDMNSNRIINLPEPVSSHEAARKQDVDSVVAAGLPDQTAHAGKFIQTDGSVVSWEVPAASEVSNTPAGNIVATTVQAAIDELDGQDTTLQTNIDNHINDPSAAHAASAIANTPAGTIAATDVQAALNELDTEKVPTTTSINTASLSGLSGGGALSASRNLSLDVSNLTAETVLDLVNDYIPFYDASVTAQRKVAIGDLPGSANATETTAGIVELATQAEVDAGVDTTRAITPATLWGSNFGGMDLVTPPVTVSVAVAFVDFTSINTATYDDYVILFEGVTPATDSVRLDLQIYVSGVLKTSGYIDGGGAAETGMGCSIATVGNLSSEGVDGPIYIGGANNASTKPRINNSATIATDSTGSPSSTVSGTAAGINFQYNTASTFDGFRILFSSGNIAAGTIYVYGRRK